MSTQFSSTTSSFFFLSSEMAFFFLPKWHTLSSGWNAIEKKSYRALIVSKIHMRVLLPSMVGVVHNLFFFYPIFFDEHLQIVYIVFRVPLKRNKTEEWNSIFMLLFTFSFILLTSVQMWCSRFVGIKMFFTLPSLYFTQIQSSEKLFIV